MINAAKLKDTKLKDKKYLFLGAGSSGIGLANLLCSALVAQGMTLKEAQSRVYMFDINGLLESTRTDLVDFQTPYAHQHAPTRDFVVAIESIKPTTIIGVSTTGGEVWISVTTAGHLWPCLQHEAYDTILDVWCADPNKPRTGVRLAPGVSNVGSTQLKI
jgi:malic enzyme